MFATSLSSASCIEDQTLHQEIADSVARLLQSGHWASYQSPIIDELKAEIGKHLGASSVRLCSSGSMAIELALRGSDLREGDEVICPALDYPGNIRAIRLLGALPVVVDAAVNRWTLDVDQVTSAASQRTRVVMISHLYGEIADVIRLRRICDDSGWLLIEDACQMPGGSFNRQALGSFGHVAAFSFGGSKPVTAGTGGAVVTNDPRIAQRITSYVERPSEMCALSALQAAVLLPQWKRIDELNRRHLEAMLTLVNLISPKTPTWEWPSVETPNQRPCFYKLPIRLKPSGGQDKRQHIIHRLNEEGVSAGEPFRVVKTVGKNRGRLVGFQNAQQLCEKSFLLDHRCVIGPSSRTQTLTEKLFQIHQETVQ